MITVEDLNLLGFLLSITLLGYSAYSDLKTREVSNWVWVIYLPLACIILGFKLFLNPQLLTVSLISVAVTAGLSFLVFYVGLFGGADFKAFICLSIALPTSPFPIESTLGSINPLLPVAVFYNAYLLSLSTVFYAVIKNLDWKYRKGKELFNELEETPLSKRMMVLLTGYKTSFETLREKVYLYPMEEISKDSVGSHRRLKLFTDAETDREELVKNLEESLKDSEKVEVWATPGIPLLLFAWIALILNAFVGDILLWIVFQIVSRVF